VHRSRAGAVQVRRKCVGHFRADSVRRHAGL
jgi:hypothetical protein